MADEILKRLSDQRVLSLETLPDGSVKIWEECDHYFNEVLTRDELKALGERLIEMASAPVA